MRKEEKQISLPITPGRRYIMEIRERMRRAQSLLPSDSESQTPTIPQEVQPVHNIVTLRKKKPQEGIKEER